MLSDKGQRVDQSAKGQGTLAEQAKRKGFDESAKGKGTHAEQGSRKGVDESAKRTDLHDESPRKRQRADESCRRQESGRELPRRRELPTATSPHGSADESPGGKGCYARLRTTVVAQASTTSTTSTASTASATTSTTRATDTVLLIVQVEDKRAERLMKRSMKRPMTASELAEEERPMKEERVRAPRVRFDPRCGPPPLARVTPTETEALILPVLLVVLR